LKEQITKIELARRREAILGVVKLRATIQACKDRHDPNPIAFKWTRKAGIVLEKIRRARTVFKNVRAKC